MAARSQISGQKGKHMIPYSDFYRLMMDAKECASVKEYIAECGGSVPLDDAAQTMQLLERIWSMAHEALTIKTISDACGIAVRQIALNYHIPQRTLENWSNGSRAPSEWQLPLIAYAVVTDDLTKLAENANEYD